MFFVWVLLLSILQMTLLRGVNLLAVLAVFAGLRKGAGSGLVIGLAIGIVGGLLSSSSFGLNIVLYGMVGLLSGLAKSRIFYKEDIFMEVVFSFCGVILFYSMYFILTKISQASILSTALFSAALSPVLFRIVEK